MTVIHPTKESLHHCEGDPPLPPCKVRSERKRIEQLANNEHDVSNDESTDGETPTESTQDPNASSSDPTHTSLGKAIGSAMLQRASQFRSIARLPKDETRRIRKLSWQDVRPGRLLGTGGFSSVFDVSIQTNDDFTSGKFAIKVLDKNRCTRRGGIDRLSQAAADLALEAKFLSRLDHENIIHLHAMKIGCPSKSFDDEEGFFLILDRLDETLHHKLARWRLSNHDNVLGRLQDTAMGIVKGMEYLHNNGIVFRDLKAQNVGYCAQTGVVKIFDFGLGACITSANERRTTLCGTFRCMAPEVMMAEGYSFPCDVYSFGILLWSICSLQMTFAYKIKKRAEFIEWVVRRGGRPSLKSLKCPKRINRLIKECWHKDPSVRPTFTTIRRRLEKVIANQGENSEITPSA